MPNPLEEITTMYGEQYQNDAAEEPRIKAWAGIVDAILELFPHMRTTLDVGCGAGRLGLEFEKRGLDAWGIEGSIAAIGKLDARILLWDLRKPLTCLQKFDLVTCFDVGEHVGNAEALADTLAAATGKWLLFGAAPPGQDGHGHIDCRPYEDWHALFEARDLQHIGLLTRNLKEAITAREGTNYMWWVEKNVHVYRKGRI